MTIGDRIRLARQHSGFTQEDLAKASGTSKQTIYKYEMNIVTNIPSDRVEAIAKLLGVSPAYLMGWDDFSPNSRSNDSPSLYDTYDNIMPIKTKKIPLLGEIACGVPIYADEDRESYVEVGTEMRADFALKAKGDSMTGAFIRDGDVVFIRKQQTVDEGDIAAVIIDDEATLKRVYFHKDINAVELRAENAAYKSLIYAGPELDQLHILGKAIAFQSDVR